MIKAYPRVWVDLTTAEVMSVIFQILNPSKARGRSRMPEFERAYAEFIGTRELFLSATAVVLCTLALKPWTSKKMMRLSFRHSLFGQKQQLLFWQG